MKTFYLTNRNRISLEKIQVETEFVKDFDSFIKTSYRLKGYVKFEAEGEALEYMKSNTKLPENSYFYVILSNNQPVKSVLNEDSFIVYTKAQYLNIPKELWNIPSQYK